MRYKSNNKKPGPIVGPPCRKTIYNTREDADDMIKYISESRITKNIRPYKCTVCGFWHLTSSGNS